MTTAACFAGISLLALLALVAVVPGPVYAREQYQLSTSHLLLPYPLDGVSVEHTLHASGGCFEWTTTRPNLISFVNQPKGCSDSITVQVVPEGGPRLSGSIVAREVSSDRHLRCDVTIDTLKTVDLLTVSRTYYVGDAPFPIVVQGRDAEGNTFSSLSHLPFSWSVLDNDCNPSPSALARLRMLNFDDVEYEAPQQILQLEALGHHGFMLLVQAVRSGRVCVNVKLQHESSALQASAIVTLIEHLQLDPIDVYTVPGQFIHYDVTTHQGTTLDLSSGDVSLISRDEKVAVVRGNNGRVESISAGTTYIFLQDREGLMDASSSPNAQINVVNPAKLVISVETCIDDSLTTCVVAVDGKYSVQLFLMDIHGNKILTNGLSFTTEVSASGVFDLTQSTKNNTWHLGDAKALGKITINAYYFAPNTKAADGPTLEAYQDVHVVNPIRVSPSKSVVPWGPRGTTDVAVALKATGGSGAYTWSSGDSLVAHVAQGRVTPVGIGRVSISAYDQAQASIHDTAIVDVVRPTALRVVAAFNDVPIGETVVVSAEFLDHNGKVFEQCQHLTPSWRVPDDAFEIVSQDCNAGCACVVITAHRVSKTTVTASWGPLHDEVILGAHKKLAIHDNDRHMLVSNKASHTLHFSGGPRAHDKMPELFVREIVAEKPAWVKFHTNTADLSSYIVECVRYGCQTVTVRVGNKAHAALNFDGLIESDSAQFCCSRPTRLQVDLDLSPEEKLLSEHCPIEDHSVFVVKEKVPYKLIAHPFVDHMAFTNSSTLTFTWSSYETLAIAKDTFTASVRPSKPHLVTVEVKTRGERDTIQDSLHLRARPALTVSPSVLSLVDVLNSSAVATISGGSGHFTASTRDPSLVVDVDGEHLVVATNAIGSAPVEVEDLCLLPRKQVETVNVDISTVRKIRVFVQDKLQLGGSAPAELCLYDKNDREVPSSVYDLISFSAQRMNDFAKASPNGQFSEREASQCRGKKFTIRGVDIGMAILNFTASIPSKTSGSYSLSTSDIAIQVFSPVTTHPKELVLLVTSCHQLRTVGLPTYGTTDVFYSTQDTRITVTSDGTVCGEAVGNASVSVHVTTNDGAVVISQSIVRVRVVQIDAVEIVIPPPEHLILGNQMEVYVNLLFQNTVVYGDKHIEALWNSDDADVVSVSSLFPHENRFSELYASLSALGEGRARVSVVVACDAVYCAPGVGSELHAAEEVAVVGELKLVGDSKIMVPLNAKFQVSTNYANSVDLRYQVISRGSDCALSLPRSSISADGFVRAADAGEDVLVNVAHVLRNKAIQHVQMAVDVRPVKHITLIPEAACHRLSVKVHCSVKVVFQDGTGRTFSATDQMKLVAGFSNRDVARAHVTSSDTIVVTATGPGEALLHVFLEDFTEIRNFLRINVVAGLSPSFILAPIGSDVCFRLGQTNTPGIWKTGNSKVAKLKSPGHFVIVGEGTGVLSVVDEEYTLTAQVTSEEFGDVALQNVPGFVTNLESHNTYEIDVHITSQSGAAYTPLQSCAGDVEGLQPLAEVSCALSQQDQYMGVSPVFDPHTGRHFCRVLIRQRALFARSSPTVTVTVTVSSRLTQAALSSLGQGQAPSLLSGKSAIPEAKVVHVDIPVAPAFSLGVSKVVISAKVGSTADIPVSNAVDPAQLAVLSSDYPFQGCHHDDNCFESQLFRVNVVESKTAAGEAQVSLLVTALTALSEDTRIVVMNKQTKQSKSVDIVADVADRSMSPDSAHAHSRASDGDLDGGSAAANQSAGNTGGTLSSIVFSYFHVIVLLFFVAVVLLYRADPQTDNSIIVSPKRKVNASYRR